MSKIQKEFVFSKILMNNIKYQKSKLSVKQLHTKGYPL